MPNLYQKLSKILFLKGLAPICLSRVSPKIAERMMAPLSVPNSEQEDGSCILIGPLVLYDESKDDVVLQFDFMLSISALPKTPPFSVSL